MQVASPLELELVVEAELMKLLSVAKVNRPPHKRPATPPFQTSPSSVSHAGYASGHFVLCDILACAVTLSCKRSVCAVLCWGSS